jgi:hypothetical protein
MFRGAGKPHPLGGEIKVNSAKVWLLIAMSTLLVCCQTEDVSLTPQSPTPAVIFPLAVGNYWVRERIVYDTSGVVSGSQIDTVKVLGDSLLQGERWFIVSRDGGRYLVTNRSTGLWIMGAGSPSMQYEYPGEPGDTFVFTVNTSPVRVVHTDSSITVPAGTFSCYVYETSWPSSRVHVRWSESFCPEIGFIGSESHQSQSDTSRLYLYGRIRLLSYRLY